MVLFIDDKPIKIVKKDAIKKLKGGKFDTMIDARLDGVNPKKMQGHVIILNATSATVEKLFDTVINKRVSTYDSVTLVVEAKKPIQEQIKKYYKVVKAAGGIVLNQNHEVLLMHRLDKWDLPKGKQDAGEKSKQTAVREVNEECSISVQLGKKVCTTWHTYTYKGSNILKRTRWYEMICTDESEMKPQLEENISELKWMNKASLDEAMLDTYSSIRLVIECWRNSQPA